MGAKVSIYDGLPYLYAEQLHNKQVPLTIANVVGGAEFVSADGRRAIGFDVSFKETEKKLGITGVTVRRQLTVATGTDDPDGMIGKRIILYSVESKKSAAGCAIRIKKCEQPTN